MSARLETLLIEQKVLPEATVRAATARQWVYGGGLDTALLELGALTEAQIWARLAAVTGLPVPPPRLADGSEVPERPALPSHETAPMRFVPVGADTLRLNLLCAEPVATDAIRNLAAAHGFEANLFVIPELRLFALRQRVYGEPLPQRYAPLLARAMGAERARKNFGFPRRRLPDGGAVVATVAASGADGFLGGPPSWRRLALRGAFADTPLGHVMDLSGGLLPGATVDLEMEVEGASDDPMGDGSVSVPTRVDVLASFPLSDGVPEAAELTPAEVMANSAAVALCRRARDADDKGRTLALRVLRRRMNHPVAQQFVQELRYTATLDAPEALAAIESLAEMRDEGAIPIFISRLAGSSVGRAARRALIAITALDFEDAAAWKTWWQRNARRTRAAWLLDALGQKDIATRLLAFEELRHLSDETFGYSPELPRRKREAARRRWVAWWEARSPRPLATEAQTS
jgi:hypothetical protein